MSPPSGPPANERNPTCPPKPPTSSSDRPKSGPHCPPPCRMNPSQPPDLPRAMNRSHETASITVRPPRLVRAPVLVDGPGSSRPLRVDRAHRRQDDDGRLAPGPRPRAETPPAAVGLHRRKSGQRPPTFATQPPGRSRCASSWAILSCTGKPRSPRNWSSVSTQPAPRSSGPS